MIKQKNHFRVICHNCLTTILPEENVYTERGYCYCESCGDGKAYDKLASYYHKLYGLPARDKDS